MISLPLTPASAAVYVALVCAAAIRVTLSAQPAHRHRLCHCQQQGRLLEQSLTANAVIAVRPLPTSSATV